jgi:phytoene dehydrogenase-like protein
VREVIVERGRAVGVVTDNGETIARAICRLQRQSETAVYGKLLDPAALPPDFRERISALAQRLRHVPHERRAVALPSFTALPGRAAIISPPASSWRRASPTWIAPISTRAPWLVAAPVVEMLIPSTLDDTLAPPGQHVASLFCQHVAPECPTARPGTTIARKSPIS